MNATRVDQPPRTKRLYPTRGMNWAAGIWAIVMMGMSPATSPRMVAEAPSDLANRTMGPASTIWKERALKSANA